MKPVERYVAAYVIQCLFPEAVEEGVHTRYIEQVLRETSTQPRNEVLRNVLDFVRQGDPSDPYVQSMVRDYIRSMVVGSIDLEPKTSPFKAQMHRSRGYVAGIVLKDNIPVAFAGGMEEDYENLKARLNEQFPGIVFSEV